jgi:sugar O-acyltransferase (sialic acid O-acetyltransferase NeuD family)
MKPLLILGTRTLAVEIADIASDIPGFEVAGFVENLDRSRCSETLEGLPILWIDALAELKESHCAVGGLATTHREKFIRQAAEQGIAFATLVHPSARVSKKAKIAAGAIVSAGCILSAHAEIGNHVFLNRGVLIGHHTAIGDFTTVQPGANIAGCCRIGNRAYVGMGAMIVDDLSIGARSFIGAGSVVTKNVPEAVQVFGVPAKVVRVNLDGH